MLQNLTPYRQAYSVVGMVFCVFNVCCTNYSGLHKRKLFFCDKFVLKKEGLSAQGTITCLNGPYTRTQCGPKVPGLNFLPLSYQRHLPGRD